MRRVVMVVIATLMNIFACFAPHNPIPSKSIQEILKEKNEKLISAEIDRIAYTLRIHESGCSYDTAGASGEYGAYQFMPGTWEALCIRYADTILDFTPVNQDFIAKSYIKTLYVDSSYTIEQIASVWNCGNKEWHGKVGINKRGVKYNVPKYVELFMVKYSAANNV